MQQSSYNAEPRCIPFFYVAVKHFISASVNSLKIFFDLCQFMRLHVKLNAKSMPVTKTEQTFHSSVRGHLYGIIERTFKHEQFDTSLIPPIYNYRCIIIFGIILVITPHITVSDI